ncbi:MAG TPA: aminodeoxychorismate/anthranilate synthase component II [Aeromonadales bacterium]|nr:aminodeoxychorismate/anthranilate synthase component II [Aeromonadales bacterium]
MLLMIDNYDSFTFNLAQYFQEIGEEITVVRNDELNCDAIAKMAPEAIIISPGPCTPDKAGISLQVVKRFKGEIPILGVCLGHQVIAQAFGATIIRAEQVMHGKTSTVSHQGKQLFSGLRQPLTVTRYHSLIVESKTWPETLVIDAWTEKLTGEPDIIMGFHHRQFPIFGVQFHPEAILTEQGHDLLNNFMRQVRVV